MLLQTEMWYDRNNFIFSTWFNKQTIMKFSNFISLISSSHTFHSSIIDLKSSFDNISLFYFHPYRHHHDGVGIYTIRAGGRKNISWSDTIDDIFGPLSSSSLAWLSSMNYSVTFLFFVTAIPCLFAVQHRKSSHAHLLLPRTILEVRRRAKILRKKSSTSDTNGAKMSWMRAASSQKQRRWRRITRITLLFMRTTQETVSPSGTKNTANSARLCCWFSWTMRKVGLMGSRKTGGNFKENLWTLRTKTCFEEMRKVFSSVKIVYNVHSPCLES